MNKTTEQSTLSENILLIFRIIFYFCALYFLLMGLGMVFFPRLLVQGVAGTEVNSTIIGMLRGAGGAIIPYTLLYWFVAKDPLTRGWALWIIAVANIIAGILDITSVVLNEYKLSYAMMDLPVEVLSLVAIVMLLVNAKTK